MNVGEKITFYREKKNITVNKLANMSGVSQSYLRDLELGKKQPTVEYLSYICDALEISLERFFSDENNENKILSLYKKMNESQQKALIDFLEKITEE
ncbi:MAG: helix-turn-helix transcriptional regulator [Clostridia bacterium]|nr:helix-turn-helix transcriptional regulator [Clostridia bacterium]